MKYAWIKEQSTAYPIAALCRFMDVSRSRYYDWLNSPKTAGEKENQALTELIKALFNQSRKSVDTSGESVARQSQLDRSDFLTKR